MVMTTPSHAVKLTGTEQPDAIGQILTAGPLSAELRPGVLGECDDRIRIPMQGRVQSLNVSAAAAVTLFEVVRQRWKCVATSSKPTGS